MTEIEELTEEINVFFKDRNVPNEILYKAGHTILNSKHFIASNLAIVNDKKIDWRIWRLGFERLNDLRIALVDKSFTHVDVNARSIYKTYRAPIIIAPPPPQERPVEKVAKKSSITLDEKQVKAATAKKKVETQKPQQNILF